MEKNYLQLNQITAYTSAFRLSNKVWKLVVDWDVFSKHTVGQQFVKAVDSISANITEGFGRYHKKDKIKFYYYSYGSVKESLELNEKSRIRKLLKEEDYKEIFECLNNLPKELHRLIRFTNERLKI